jgi:hypothetical protein
MCSSTKIIESTLGAVEWEEWEEWEDDLLVGDVPGGSEGQQAGGVAVSPWQRMARAFPFEPEPAVHDSDVRARGLVERLRHCEALKAQLDAQQARALRELRTLRLVQQAVEHPHGDGACTRACCDEDGWVAPEVGMELGLSERQVQSRIDTALSLERHPSVAAVLESGQLQGWTAVRLLDHLETLGRYVSPSKLAQVEQSTLAWLLARPRTVTQLNARLRRLILAARAAAEKDGDGPDGPDEPGHADRHVSVTPAPTPGLAELVALLPEADALAIRGMLQALGRDRVDADDSRTADQRRADLLVTLVLGRPALHGHPMDVQCALRDPVEVEVRLDVSIPADSLVGRGHVPGRLVGYGEVPARTARDVVAQVTAATGGCWARPLVYDPGTGTLTGFGPTPVRLTWLEDLKPGRGYQHAPTLEAAVRLRDGTCRAPGCTRAAGRCDCDHVVPYPDGQTSLANSCSLCRRHHRLKTHSHRWRVEVDTSGEVCWTTPTDSRRSTLPHEYRPPDLDPPPF